MSFLNDLNLDSVDETAVDFTIPAGVYPTMITDSKIMVSPSSGDNLWQITYRIDPDHDESPGKTVSEFFNLDPNLPDNRKAWIKRRLISLGISGDEAANLDPGDIIGVEVTVTVKNKAVKDKVYTNVTKVELGADVSAAAF